MSSIDFHGYQAFNWDWSFIENYDDPILSHCFDRIGELYSLNLERDDTVGLKVVTATAGYSSLNECMLTTQISMSILCFLPLPPQIKTYFVVEHIEKRRQSLFSNASEYLSVRLDICSRVNKLSFSTAKDEITNNGSTKLGPFDLFNFT